MISLISLADAKRHLKVDSDDDDEDVTDKALLATALIVDYLKQPDNEWTLETVPFVVKAAILLMLGQLYFDRENATISTAIKNILGRSRDPAMA